MTIIIPTLLHSFAICGMMLFQETDPVHFNSVLLALNTIWAVETLNWSDVLKINMYGCHHPVYSGYPLVDSPEYQCTTEYAYG